MKRRKGRLITRHVGILYLLPAIILIAMTVGYPIVHIVEMAFGNVNTFGTIMGSNGFQNFSGLWESGFPVVIRNTVIWTLGILIPTILLSLTMAYSLSLPIRLQPVFRTISIVPWAIPLTIVAIWGSMAFNALYGQVDTLLLDLHFISHRIGWLAYGKTSLPVMILIGIWVSVPFTTLTLLGGIQAIPRDVIEASSIDGARGFSRFSRIVLPLITNSLQLVVLINLAYIFNSFPIIWVMTEGGPAYASATVTTFVYQLAFTDGQFGYAGAAALLAFVVLIGVALGYVALYRKTEGGLL